MFVETGGEFLEIDAVRCSEHLLEQETALLATASLELALARVMFRTPRRIGNLGFEMRTVIEQRVVPRTGTPARARIGNVWDKLLVGHLFPIGEKLVQKHAAHIRLDVNRRLVVGKRNDARRGRRAYARQFHELVDGAWQQAAIIS